MSKEIKSTEEAIIWRLGLMAKENVELEQRVHQLMDEYNRVAKELREAEMRKEEDPTRQMLSEMRQMRDHCDKLEVESNYLNKFLIAVSSFLKNHKLYMAYGASCPYRSDHLAVSLPPCRDCCSYLSDLEDCGVICRKKLSDANISFTRAEDS